MGGGFSASVGGGGPSSVDATSAFDSSGWNVNFGGGSITSERRESAAGAAASMDAYLPYVLIAAGVLVAWRMTRRS